MTVFMYDMDGTLTPSRNKMKEDMKAALKLYHKKGIKLAIVSGSDLPKIAEQIGEDMLPLFEYLFTENGLKTYHKGKCIHSNSLVETLGEKDYQILVNACLRVLSEVELPVKRGVFLELRTGMLNVCPIGRSCTQVERDDFEEFDKVYRIREKIVKKVQHVLHQQGITNIIMSIGGQISVDVFQKGMDKSYALQFIPKEEDVYFFGDRCFLGGNDYEISLCTDRIKKVFPVTCYEDTIKGCNSILGL